MKFNLDFLRDGKKEKEVASKAFHFLSNPLNTIEAEANVPIAAVKKVTGKTLPNPITYAKEAGQQAARVPETIARSAVELETGGARKKITGSKDFSSSAVADPLRKILYGTKDGEQVQTYQKRTEGNKKVLEGSRFKGVATPLSLLAAGLTVGGDVTGFGGAEEATAKKTVQQLVEAGTTQAVKKVLGKNTPDHLAQAIANTKDKNVVKNLVRNQGSQIRKEPEIDIPAPGKVEKPVEPKAPEPVVNPNIEDLERQIKTKKELLQHAPNDTAKAKINAQATALIKEKDDLIAKDFKINNPDGANTDGFKVNNPDDARMGLDVSNPLGASTTKPLQISDPGGARPIKVSDPMNTRPIPVSNPDGAIATKLSGAAEQAHLGKEAPDPFAVINEHIKGKPAAKGQAPEKGLAAARAEQDELLKHERGQRFTTQGKNATDYSSEGYYKRRGLLKGEYTKVNKPYADRFTPDEAESLFREASRKINSTPDSVYEKDWKAAGLDKPLHAQAARFNTETAVRKALGLEPGLPTKSELKLLRIHSPQLADEVAANTPRHRKLFDFAADVAGSSRGLKSGLDFSMGGRQGLFVAARHPVQWAQANKESVKFAKDENYFIKRMKNLSEDPWIVAGDGHDIGLQGVKGMHEEAFTNNNLADKVPGVARSERAYTGGLSELRASLWKNALQKYGATPEEAAANLGEKGMEGLAESVRTLTGRGGKAGGFVDKRASTLGEALFSPRLWASRLQPFSPAYWKRIGPAGRKEAFQSLGSFAAVAGLALSAAVAAGADVETDPRSSDFLKIKVGDTRYDILGGFQQNLVFGWRQLTGETKSSQSGKVTHFARDIGDVLSGKKEEDVVDQGITTPNRLTVGADLVGNKAAPLISSGMKLLAGKDKSGNAVNPLTEIGQLFVPIGLQGTYHAFQRDGLKGVAKNAPDFVGIGTQTYGTKDINVTGKQKEYLDKLGKSGAKKEQVEAAKSFFQQVKVAPSRDNAAAPIKEALKAGDSEKAKKLAKEYNEKYAASFKPWIDSNPKYKSDKALMKEYNSNKITSESLKRWLATIKEENKGL